MMKNTGERETMGLVSHLSLWETKVEASITDKNERFCICLGGVIAGNCFSCQEKQFLRRMQFLNLFSMNMGISTDFKAVKFRVTHN